MNRREFGKKSVLSLVGAGLASRIALTSAVGAIALVEEGCTVTLASVLNEAGNILAFVAPLGDGIAAIVEVVDPAVAPLVMAAVAVYDAAIPAIEKLLADWSAASASAQPGILAQIEAAITALQTDVMNIIGSIKGIPASALAEANLIISTILGEISALIKDIANLMSAGGTKASLSKMKFAMYAPDARVNRDSMVKRLKIPTGTPMDAPRMALADKLSSIQFKK